MSRYRNWCLRLAVSAVILGVIAWFVPLDALAQAARGVPAWLALAVVAGFLLGHVVAALKWRWLMSPHAEVPVGLAMRAHFTGLTANLCLPGIAGGDVVRAACVMRQTHSRAGVGVASLADRLLDCLALLTLSAAGVLLVAKADGPFRDALLVGAAVVGVPLVLGGLACAVLSRLKRGGIVGRVAEAAGVLLRNPGVLAGAFALSLVVQAGFVGLNLALGTAAGVEVPSAAWLVAWPLAKLVALAPVSLNGLGVREAALVFFMRPFGASPAAVTAASLFWQAVLMVGSLAGAMAVTTPARSKVTQPEPVAVP